jgi:hypothetical protein
MERLGFYVCKMDLEGELIRCLGASVVEEVLAGQGKLGSFRTYQKQLAHRARPTEEQLRGFLTNWKIELAGPLVEALDLSRVPRRSTACSRMSDARRVGVTGADGRLESGSRRAGRESRRSTFCGPVSVERDSLVGRCEGSRPARSCSICSWWRRMR